VQQILNKGLTMSWDETGPKISASLRESFP
jgi:hypothetical protein